MKAGDKVLLIRGITPAWAGKSEAGLDEKHGYKDHPRVGGEKSKRLRGMLPTLGSPPRGRGKVHAEIERLSGFGITPAWAGKRGANKTKSP